MNGLNLLVLISLFGQAGFPPPPSVSAGPQVSSDRKDYGWQINPRTQILEYIIQIPPEQVQTMQMQAGQKMEKYSLMPEELVGRARKIVVRIGTDDLPRTPTLEELKRMPRFRSGTELSSLLGPGNMTDMDQSPVVNVQNRPPNSPLPSTPQNPVERARQIAEQATLPDLPSVGGLDSNAAASAAQDFLSRARMTDQDPPSLPGTGGAMPAYPSTSNKYNQTGAEDPQRQLTALPTAGSDTSGWSGRTGAEDFARIADGRADALSRGRSAPSSYDGTAGGIGADRRPRQAGGLNVGADGYPDYAQGERDPYAGAYTYEERMEQARIEQARLEQARLERARLDRERGYDPTSYGTPADRPETRAPEEKQYVNGYDAEGFDPAGFNRGGFDRNGYNRLGQSSEEVMRLAQTQALTQLPTTGNVTPGANPGTQPRPVVGSQNNAPGTGTQGGLGAGISQLDGTGANGKSASDLESSRAETIANTKKTGDMFVQMFFLISLVANVYLVFLIRRLLTRYRSLLTTVRGHAAI